MESLDHILIFKTDISTEAYRNKLQALLDDHDGILQWNIALDDPDCILRVISYTLNPQEIIELITHHGHFCCELI